MELYADLGQVIRDSLRDHFGARLSPEEYMDHTRLLAAIRAEDPALATTEAAAHTGSCEAAR
jgi:DNA-binding FadR family transcriptional regulator